METFIVLLSFLCLLIFVTIALTLYEWLKYRTCVNKEHPTCPIFNCEVADNHQFAKDPTQNYCGLNAWRIDSQTNEKICSGFSESL